MMVMLAVWCVMRITYITITLHFYPCHRHGILGLPHHGASPRCSSRGTSGTAPSRNWAAAHRIKFREFRLFRQADFLQQKVLLLPAYCHNTIIYVYLEGAYKMAKIAVVEDNDAMREQLCGFIAQYARESGRQLDVTAFCRWGRDRGPLPSRL